MLVGFVSFSQTTVKGNVSDEAKEPVIGANISIKGTAEGTITDIDGNFELTTEQATPFTIVISMVGLANVEKEITGNTTDLAVEMKEETNLLNTVVVSASRVEEKILESPVTIEKMDQKMVKQSSSSDYYDDLSKLKGYPRFYDTNISEHKRFRWYFKHTFRSVNGWNGQCSTIIKLPNR